MTAPTQVLEGKKGFPEALGFKPSHKREYVSATQWWWRSSSGGRSDEVGVWLEGQEGRA